jgi:hypothetical protein
MVATAPPAGGHEASSGKLASPESSAALAVNTFDWFHDRPVSLPPFPTLSETQLMNGAGSKGRRNTCAQFTRWSLKAQTRSFWLRYVRKENCTKSKNGFVPTNLFVCL